jgi:hypothetical protein
MTRRIAARTAMSLLGLLTLAACVVNLSFSMDHPGIVLKSTPPATSVSESVLVDLAKSKEITDHKDNIKSLDLDYVDVTITATGAGHTANTVTGSLKLCKTLPSQTAPCDLVVGTLNAFQLKVGQTVRLNGTPQLDAFLFQQLQQEGRFYAVVEGAIDSGAADVTVDLNMHASIGYDAGIF